MLNESQHMAQIIPVEIVHFGALPNGIVACSAHYGLQICKAVLQDSELSPAPALFHDGYTINKFLGEHDNRLSSG